MKIEDEIFKRFKVRKNELINYGFIEENNLYKYSTKIMNDTFRVDIEIDFDGNVTGKVIDLDFNEEYTNYRVENIVGEFANRVKEEYIDLLQDIAEKCYFKNYYIYDQSNRINCLIKEKYNVEPEFLWKISPGFGVYRNPENEKWFGLIMNIDKNKVDSTQRGEIEVINIKLDDKVQESLNINGIYPAYHMNKKSWVSVILDETLSDEKIMELIELSHSFSK